jgi:hypothetical protein
MPKITKENLNLTIDKFVKPSFFEPQTEQSKELTDRSAAAAENQQQ